MKKGRNPPMRRYVMPAVLTVSLLLIASTTCFCAAETPISQGSRIVAGSVSFDSRGGEFYEDANGKRETEWRLFPSGGYFVKDRLAMTLLVELSSVKQGKFLDQLWALGPAVRYFFDLDKDRPGGTYMFVSGAYLIGQYIHDSAEILEEREQYSLQGFRVDTGFIYMLSRSVGATITIFFDNSWIKQQEPEKGESWISGNDIGFEFGFTTFLF
jgi:hypothetical protein